MGRYAAVPPNWRACMNNQKIHIEEFIDNKFNHSTNLHAEKRKIENEIPDGYVRVTELLAPYSGLSGIDPLVLAKAADRGKRAHTYCELYAQSMLIEEVDEDCKGFVESFAKWMEIVKPEILSLEERLLDPEYRLTGAYDMIVRFPGSRDKVLVDIKTPISSNKTWSLQTAAYDFMLLKQQRPVQRRGCLMIDRKGSVASFKEHSNIEDRSIFLGILRAYRYFNP